jgi:hypothetical protein
MEQHHGGPIPRHLVLDADSIDLDPHWSDIVARSPPGYLTRRLMAGPTGAD